MDRVGMEGRTGDIQEQNCSKCGGPILSVNGVKRCPRCTKPEAETNAKFVAKLSDGTTKTFNSQAEFDKFIGIKPKVKPNGALVQHGAQQNEVTDAPVKVGIDAAFILIDKELQSAQGKVDDLNEIKKIIGLRKKLNGFKFDVQTLIGGK